MSRRLKKAVVVAAVVFAAAQFVRPGRANPVTDPSRTIQFHAGTSSALAAVLDRSCHDCHSNRTVWPWYTEVAPLSWLMAYAVKDGRQVVNFSEWAAYPPDRQQRLLAGWCKATSQGTMPGSAWTWLRPETRLSGQDVDTICAAVPP